MERSGETGDVAYIYIDIGGIVSFDFEIFRSNLNKINQNESCDLIGCKIIYSIFDGLTNALGPGS